MMLPEMRRHERDERAPDADPEVRDPHGLAARAREPVGEQDLVGQGAAAHIAERIQEIEDIERREAGDGGEPDWRQTQLADRVEQVHRR